MGDREPIQPLTFLLLLAAALLAVALSGCQYLGDRDLIQRQADAVQRIEQINQQLHALRQQQQTDRAKLAAQLREEAAKQAAAQIAAWGEENAIDVGQLNQQIASTIEQQQREQIAPQIETLIREFAQQKNIEADGLVGSLRTLEASIEADRQAREKQLAEQEAEIREQEQTIAELRASLPDPDEQRRTVVELIKEIGWKAAADSLPWGGTAAALISAGWWFIRGRRNRTEGPATNDRNRTGDSAPSV